jgi:ribosomal protein L12E/L44/L45/RPP1/RPP2
VSGAVVDVLRGQAVGATVVGQELDDVIHDGDLARACASSAGNSQHPDAAP